MENINICKSKTEEKLLIVNGVIKKYSNEYLAVKEASFSMKKGECLGLVGESGSGKSTLARCILMLEKMTKGEIWLNGQALHNIKGSDLKKKQRRMQAVFQNPTSSLNPKLKILDSLIEPLDYQCDINPSFLKGIRSNRRKSAQVLLDMVQIPTKYLDCYPHELSGGQKQRIIIARAISVEPWLIVLDEPTASLDVSIQARVLNLLKDLQQNLKLSYFFISHDLSAVNFMCQRMMVMKDGKIVDRFSRKDLFNEERSSYTKRLLEIFGT
ncbi:peptide/nickel transport system ATP-binding protein [Clostridium tetanomorphum]|uniref:ABC transporter ATP-binding protein n=1 Tax=Clostridium tetanomorphum TaxID=1553 RepID=A0A923EA57_CLOTT|nr:dipeptide/oligopeptide/nickel ABC transporter ATP-binding protein [Clostridium tetanomorphum]KAJ53717.1 oligopeptide ABC transporter [Clostridium tetanomorphum DSM 665]MBC2397229.1 ABC transporter ATP-binding protein [Clostridium tetanomorphum]MBP1862445.1 peptide/nickel transport system ATP-binding protein [Clostridium tetanomorphum]NRS85715.1 peptide/nickel transport system ATP-binding protein [Clostridium tetanomorphum]NRZ96275.1 peptide/nickel transport system ATP-binding protein [Clost